MRLILISVSLAAVLLSGCATVKGAGEDLKKVLPSSQQARSAPAPVAPSLSHVDCEVQQQTGCWELRVLSFGWDAKNPALTGLDRPYGNQAERQERAQFLGPKLWELYRAGKLQAAKPRSYLVYMWNVSSVPTSNLSAYRVNSPQHTVTKVTVEEVQGAKAPVFDQTVSNLGAPQRVFRVRTDGTDAVAASVQVPWTMVTGQTYILICPEGTPVVYPAGKDMGLWITPPSLSWLKGRESKRGLVPFIAAN